jgi:hypothetical protein
MQCIWVYLFIAHISNNPLTYISSLTLSGNLHETDVSGYKRGLTVFLISLDIRIQCVFYIIIVGKNVKRIIYPAQLDMWSQ